MTGDTASSAWKRRGRRGPSADSAESRGSALDDIDQKLIVMSGKGGVGKTSVAVSLSLALAELGFTVGLMDIDVHGPDTARILGLSGMAQVDRNRRLTPVRFSANLHTISIEFLMPDKDKAIVWRGPMKHSAIRQFIHDVEWGRLDYLVIDAPPGTGDEPLSVAQNIPGARAVIVTTPQEISLADVRKSIHFCRQVDMAIAGIVENMGGFACPHCGRTIELFGSGGGQKTAKAEDIRFLGSIPFHPDMVACSNTGRPFITAYADSPAAQAFFSTAEQLAGDKQRKQGHRAAARRMKIAMPLVNGKLSSHLSLCRELAVLDLDGRTITKKELLDPPPQAPGALAGWLQELGIDVLAAGGIAQRDMDLLQELGITVVTGTPMQTPEAVVAQYLDDNPENGNQS